MACDILPPPSSTSAFSPLTLFECTITNAQMLIETMADRDLLHALKIASSLHTHIVGVIEPRYDRACQRSDDHEACCQAAAATVGAGGKDDVSGAAAESTHQPQTSKSGVNNGSGGGMPCSPATVRLPQIKSETSFASVKSEMLDAEGFDEEDDCLILEEDCTFASAGLATIASPSATSSSSQQFGASSVGRKRNRPSSPSLAGAASSASAAAAPAHLAECKVALRQAYKDIKGNGPHLFDFSLPFNDAANHRVSEQIIAAAQRQMGHARLSHDNWWNSCLPSMYEELAKYDRHRERMKFRMRARRLLSSKLARRQKSFELLATSLSTDKFDKYRIILSRDYTSSDEEAEDDGALRVRELPWESDEIKEMKRQLDAVFIDNCASQKQAQQLRATVRDSGSVSGRTPPANCPQWALAPQFH